MGNGIEEKSDSNFQTFSVSFNFTNADDLSSEKEGWYLGGEKGTTDIYAVDSVIGFASTYPLDSGLSDGYRYPAFEQPGPGAYVIGQWLQSVLHLQC